MNERGKITASHLARHAVVYLRQSSAAQVEHNRESTERQYALARVGLVLGLEVSRLARNNAEWYRLIDLAGLTDTLIGDGDGLYHPAVFNDRLLLGLNGMVT